ncbi:MAG: tyrosine-type recombinase/integrase [Desulfobacterales bacterium]|nr:tyrosine-type recombinase/integrase [Desulfobacterales bacterium]
MNGKVFEKLEKAIDDYLAWMISKNYAKSTCIRYHQILKYFFVFISQKAICWEDVLTFNTLKDFQKESGLIRASNPVMGLSRYLFEQNKIQHPIEKPIQKLPEIYEDYLLYYAKTRQVHHLQILRSRRTLQALTDYLARHNIKLPNIRIEHIDAFLSERNVNFTPITRQDQRSNVRQFLRYLYQERRILKRNLAPLIVGAPLFAQAKPPRFLRSDEVHGLFDSLSTCCAKALRTSAMIHLGYTLGLRPKEIGLITLDDISFGQCEIHLPDRKSNNPIKLPLPEVTIKAIAAYIVGARAKSSRRRLFLSLRAPYEPITPAAVSKDIGLCMRKAGLSSSAYWLRHTYAQNLLEAGASVFEIKQMLGHDRIQTTQRYIHIHTRLMREVLFDDSL